VFFGSPRIVDLPADITAIEQRAALDVLLERAHSCENPESPLSPATASPGPMNWGQKRARPMRFCAGKSIELKPMEKLTPTILQRRASRIVAFVPDAFNPPRRVKVQQRDGVLSIVR
jgi:hypothetical protein